MTGSDVTHFSLNFDKTCFL